MYFLVFQNENMNYDNNPENTPITFNQDLKKRLTTGAILTVYLALFIEYIINPHSIYNNIIMPPCIVLESYIGYNIFIIGVPLAIFLHIKMSNYQYFGYYGILATVEFVMATIILSFDKIRAIHGLITIFLLVVTGVQIMDYEFDRSMSLFENVVSVQNNFFSILYFGYIVLSAVTLSVYWAVNDVEQGHLDNFTDIVYILTMVVWIATQWVICVSLSNRKPYGLDLHFGILFIVLSFILVALSNEYPGWHLFALNEKRPWEA